MDKNKAIASATKAYEAVRDDVVRPLNKWIGAHRTEILAGVAVTDGVLAVAGLVSGFASMIGQSQMQYYAKDLYAALPEGLVRDCLCGGRSGRELTQIIDWSVAKENFTTLPIFAYERLASEVAMRAGSAMVVGGGLAAIVSDHFDWKAKETLEGIRNTGTPPETQVAALLSKSPAPR